MRFIPTGVGNAQIPQLLIDSNPVHPHGCGERTDASGARLTVLGSSPRVWGTRKIIQKRVCRMWFIPTGVGNAANGTYVLFVTPVHPHGCGERNPSPFWLNPSPGSSPRVWGTLEELYLEASSRRFIPTGVGNAFEGKKREPRDAVHPHGCGERNGMHIRNSA